MINLFQNKKWAVLSIILAVVLVVGAVGAGILVWHLTKDNGPDGNATYTVSFVTNGGNAIEALEVEGGTVLSQADLPVPSKRGELFLSWNMDEALTQPYWDTPIESDMTLYASYVPPSNEATTEELVSSIIPFASTDFSVTVRSSEPLTNENIAQYTILAVNYGQHSDGEEIKLSVTHEGGDIYRLSGNFASGGEYIIYLISEAIKFNPDDEMLAAYGLTDALRTLQFRIIGDAYTEGKLSDKVADIPASSVVMNDGNSLTVTGSDLNLIGATEDENGIIKVGEGDELSNYYKVVSIEATDGNGTTYSVRPAEVDEIYDQLVGYEWKDLSGDELVLNEEIKQQVIDNLANNEQLNNYIKYIALASTYTSTYEELSREHSDNGELVPLTTVVTPAGARVGVEFDVYNDSFNHILTKEDQRDGFVKLTLGFEYQVKLAKVGGQGTITALIDMQIDFWIWVGVGGYFEVGWGEYDIDAGMTTLTQTEVTFSISLMTDSSKKAVNIDDEIEAIFNSAKDPTPENLLEQYNELMRGSSKPIEICDQDIFELPVLSFLYGAVEISIPVKFVVSLDMEATFTSYFTVLSGCDVGLVGDEDSGLDLYFNRMYPRFKYRIELRGHIEMRVGVEVSLKLSLAYNLASVSLGVQAGFYGEIYGYFFYEVDRLDGITATNRGGAYYFELGTYVDIRLRAEVCKIKYSGSLWDQKYPFFGIGEKEILYGFVNPVGDIIELDNYNREVHMDDTGILDVYVYDITEPRSDKNPKKVEDYPFNLGRFEVSFSNDSFEYLGNGKIYFNDTFLNGEIFEATMTMNYTGSQLSFRDTLTKYVTVRMALTEDVDWDKVDEKYSVDFTIDGEVIFTREYSYGSTICFEPSGGKSYILNRHLEHYMYNGKLISDLRESEREALHNAGYAEARWYIMKGDTGDRETDLIIVTEDMTIEAEMAKRRPWVVTLTEGENVTTYEVDHGQTLMLPYPSKTEIDTIAYSYLFAGWKSNNGDIYSAVNEHVITKDLTLTTHYQSTAKKYNVTFNASGGKIGDGETFTTQFFYGEMPECPVTPMREGTDSVRYEFIGWSPMITKAWRDVTYVAQWREIKLCTVTFDAGEGQFDEDGTKTFTITVEDGHALTNSDFPTAPYRKVTGGYNELAAWGISVGTIVTGDATYTATYKDELISKAFITISDGVNSEDISAYLDGTNKVSGYTYTLNTEHYGNVLEITGSGLTVSGNTEDIHIRVINTEVTLDGLTLTQNKRVDVLNALGEVVINIKGIVRLISNTDAEALRGDSYGEYGEDGGYTHHADADITLRGVDGKSWLVVKGQAYGIAVYGALTVESLNLSLYMPEIAYVSEETGEVYSSVAILVHNHPKGILTVKDSDIWVFQSGVVNVAWLDMTNSNLSFSAAEFVPGYASGIHMMNYRELSEPEALIKLKNSGITFTHDIAISFAVSLEDGTEYYVNTSLETTEISSAYSSLDALLADISTNGYSGMIDMDSYSSIE